MDACKIFFKKSVEEDFSSIPKKDLQKIMALIGSLAENPWPAGCEKLTGRDRYRVRQGLYRVLYSIQDEALTVWVVKVAHCEKAYR